MHITFVKKILADGTVCGKCQDVESRLRGAGHLARIDKVVVADERDPSSPGHALARDFKVGIAPFFIVRRGDVTAIYTIYLQFVREVLEHSIAAH